MLRFLRNRQSRVPDDGPTPRVDERERIYAIGDVHGRIDLLDALLEKIRADAEEQADGRNVRTVLLGDYIDRGEASAAVLARVAALHADGAICLRGNHEAALVAFLDNPASDSGWLDFGGLQTLASYGVALPKTRDSAALRTAAAALSWAMGPHVEFLRRGLVNTHVSGDVVFVHAALVPGRPLEAQNEGALLWGDPRFLQRGWQPDRLVVHGHYAAAELVEAPGRICIDTGAYFSNHLTAICLDDRMRRLAA